jgi:hypothetical protein
MVIRRQLADVKKVNMMAHVYYNKIKALADILASIGQPLRDDEFTSYVLGGLDEKYDSLVEVVHDRTIPMSPHNLFNRLLHNENCVESHRATDFASR